MFKLQNDVFFQVSRLSVVSNIISAVSLKKQKIRAYVQSRTMIYLCLVLDLITFLFWCEVFLAASQRPSFWRNRFDIIYNHSNPPKLVHGHNNSVDLTHAEMSFFPPLCDYVIPLFDLRKYLISNNSSARTCSTVFTYTSSILICKNLSLI